jgi:acetyltransferase
MVQENDLLFDAALRQCGALRAQNLEEFFDWSHALERFGPLRLAGQRILLATLPGGEGVIVTDLVEMQGMKLAQPTKETLRALRPVFPPWEISANPFDLGVCLQFHDPLKVYKLLIESALRDPQVDALAIQLPRWAARILPKDIFQVFASASAAGKPTVLWVPGTFPGQVEALQWLEERHTPVFPGPEKAIQALAVLHRFTRAHPDSSPRGESS